MAWARDVLTADGHPVNLERILGTDDTGVPGLVEVVELAGAQTHFETLVREGGVHGPACVTYVVKVALAVLHSLQNADLCR